MTSDQTVADAAAPQQQQSTIENPLGGLSSVFNHIQNAGEYMNLMRFMMSSQDPRSYDYTRLNPNMRDNLISMVLATTGHPSVDSFLRERLTQERIDEFMDGWQENPDTIIDFILSMDDAALVSLVQQHESIREIVMPQIAQTVAGSQTIGQALTAQEIDISGLDQAITGQSIAEFMQTGLPGMNEEQTLDLLASMPSNTLNENVLEIINQQLQLPQDKRLSVAEDADVATKREVLSDAMDLVVAASENPAANASVGAALAAGGMDVTDLDPALANSALSDFDFRNLDQDQLVDVLSRLPQGDFIEKVLNPLNEGVNAFTDNAWFWDSSSDVEVSDDSNEARAAAITEALGRYGTTTWVGDAKQTAIETMANAAQEVLSQSVEEQSAIVAGQLRQQFDQANVTPRGAALNAIKNGIGGYIQTEIGSQIENGLANATPEETAQIAQQVKNYISNDREGFGRLITSDENWSRIRQLVNVDMLLANRDAVLEVMMPELTAQGIEQFRDGVLSNPMMRDIIGTVFGWVEKFMSMLGMGGSSEPDAEADPDAPDTDADSDGPETTQDDDMEPSAPPPVPPAPPGI